MKRLIKCIGIAATALFCGGISIATEAAAADKNFISTPDFFNPRINLETPHISWANPYSKGPVKTLFIIPRSGMREALEIAQRLDLQYDIFAADTYAQIAPKSLSGCDPEGSHNTAQIDRLLNLLTNKYDVILMGGVEWKILPLDVRYLILKKISEGTGLLGYLPTGDEYLEKVLKKEMPSADVAIFEEYMKGFPFKAVPGLNKAASADEFISKNVKLFYFGKGRICLFKYPQGGSSDVTKAQGPYHPFVPGVTGEVIQTDYTDYDFQLAFVIRSILWAAQAVPGLELRPENMQIAGDYGQAPLDVKFQVRPPENKLQVKNEFFILNSYGERVYSNSTENQLNPQNAILSFSIPVLPIGQYRASLIVRNNQNKVLDFASVTLNINGPVRISEITLNKTSFKLEEPVAGKIILTGSPADVALKLSLYDNWGRLISESKYPINNNAVIFELKQNTGLTIINSIKAELINAKNETVHLLKKKYPISNIRPPTDEMRTILWSNLLRQNAFYSLPVFEYWRKRGIDTHYLWFTEWAPLANMRHIEVIDRIADKGADFVGQTKRETKSGSRVPCLSNPKYINEIVKKYSTITDKLKNYSVSEFTMGDECHFTSGLNDLCFSPTCIQGFKEFVSKKYKTIDKLNQAYDSSYKSFDEVVPMSLADAREAKQITRWLDHRLHMNAVWNGVFETGRNTVKSLVPDAKTGYEGSNHADIAIWNLGDYRQLADTMSVNCLYYRPFDAAAWRSFMAKDKLYSPAWFGGYGTPLTKKHHPDAQYIPWFCLFKGGTSFWIWTASVFGGSVTAPDYSFYTYFEDALDRMSEIKQGLDKMLVRSNRITDCGILYSPASIFTSAFLDSPIGKMKDFDNITQLIIDTGFQPRVYHSEEIEKGALGKNPPKFLFLMCAHSLSPAEISGIRKYVEEGGTVIADVQPGIRDASGRLFEKSGLSELFGAQPGNVPNFKLNSGLKPVSELKIEGEFMPVWADSAVKVDSGKAWGEISGVPVIIVNDFGKGKAVLLNFNINDYLSARKAWEKSPLRSLFEKIVCKICKAQPEISVTPDIPGFEITRFENGGIRYFTFLQDMIGATDGTKYGTKEVPEIKEKVNVQVNLNKKGHVYNARTGEYYGLTDKVTLPVQILDGIILASLPYKISKVELSAADSKPKQGTAFPFTLKIIQDGNVAQEEHIVQVRFFDPQGKETEHYRKKLAVKGSINDSINLALNETAGKWTVKAMDTVSKIEATAAFTVIPAAR